MRGTLPGGREVTGGTDRLRGVVLAGAVGGALFFGACADAQEGPRDQPYRVVTVVEGLDSPWGLAFLPGGDLLITEKPGRLRVVRNGRLEPRPVEGVPEVRARGQGGLLDVALHPDHASNRVVYLSFSKPGLRGATTAVVRGRFDGRRLTDVEEVFEADAWGRSGVHFGSRLAFDREGYLWVTVGERGSMREAQDLGNHNGTVNRLHDDGRIPEDNPFVGRRGAQESVWSYGHRNPQGLMIHPETGEVWAVEHGPRGGDELNRIRKGANYGWPAITFGIDYGGGTISEDTARAGMEQPVTYWVPSISPSGLVVYDGDAFPEWRGDFFIGALSGRHLARVRVRDGRVIEEERLLAGRNQRIRDVRVGPDGFLYLLVDAPRAPLLRLEPLDHR